MTAAVSGDTPGAVAVHDSGQRRLKSLGVLCAY